MANNQTLAKAKESLEEERLEDALDHLSELHSQLRQLRSVLPRMLAPMSTKQPSSEVLFTSFKNSVENTQKEINGFKEAIISEKSRKVFQKASESRRSNPKGIKPWRARDDPDWTSRKRRKLTEPQSTGKAK